MQQVADAELGHVAALFADDGEKAALELFNRPFSVYDTGWYQLEINTMAGGGGRWSSKDDNWRIGTFTLPCLPGIGKARLRCPRRTVPTTSTFSGAIPVGCSSPLHSAGRGYNSVAA